MTKNKARYKKNHINLTNENDFLIKQKDYKPLKYTRRTFNEKTETYEYIEKTQNLKAELENEQELLKDLVLERRK